MVEANEDEYSNWGTGIDELGLSNEQRAYDGVQGEAISLLLTNNYAVLMLVSSPQW
jgi:hypothetical protein